MSVPGGPNKHSSSGKRKRNRDSVGNDSVATASKPMGGTSSQTSSSFIGSPLSSPSLFGLIGPKSSPSLASGLKGSPSTTSLQKSSSVLQGSPSM